MRGSATLAALSSQQVRDILSGGVTRWEQLGGAAGTIIVLERPQDEPVRARLIPPLMEKRSVAIRIVMLVQTAEMLLALASTPNALGYCSLSLLRFEQPRDVHIVTLDGVTPGRGAAADGSYPWYLTFGLIVRHDAPPAVRRFVAFVEGDDARPVLEQLDVAAFDR